MSNESKQSSFYKLIENYENNPEFTPLEKDVIHEINNHPQDFIYCDNVKTFCANFGIVSTTLQRIAKKLNYSSALNMKNELAKKYNKNNIVETQNYLNEVKIGINLDALKYFRFLEKKVSLLDWNTLDLLKENILKSKTIYTYQNDSVFYGSNFDTICNLLFKNFIKIENKVRFDLIKNNFDDNSIFIITNPFYEENELEKEMLHYFQTKQIPIFYITSIFRKQENINYIILDIKTKDLDKREDNQLYKIFYFKTLYDQIINTILLGLIKKIK